MNRDKVMALLPIMTAFANGEIVQYRECSTDNWLDLEDVTFSKPIECYRLKPLQEWRPAVVSDAVLALNGTLVRCRAWDHGSKDEEIHKSEIVDLCCYAVGAPWVIKTKSGNVKCFNRCEVLEFAHE